jgi:N-acetyl-gamma-glutamyl-phosphate reductase
MTSVAIIGASGYTGAELVRLVLGHPRLTLAGVYAHKSAGQKLQASFPQFAGKLDLTLLPYSANSVDAEVAFLALPHHESAQVGAELYRRGLTVLDLSADFRLRDRAIYEQWYGPHGAPELLPEARYGLVELHRDELRGARLVAVPGCYPTASILPLAPLLARGLISSEGIVVDAKSGVSGAGRTPGAATHYPEVEGGVRAYKVAAHRHTPEIEQELARAAKHELSLTFVPHLLPMSRGILSNGYSVPTDPSRPASDYQAALREAYRDEPFVAVIDTPPDTAFVRGSNRVHVAAFYDARARRVIAMGAIDNLVKGAAGQALQCLNVAMGWPETDGLDGVAIFP